MMSRSSETEKVVESTRRIGLLSETSRNFIDASIRHMPVVTRDGSIQVVEGGERLVFVAARER